MLGTIVEFIFALIIVGMVLGILLWLVENPKIPLPDPVRKVGVVIIYVGGAFILIWALLGLIGQAPPLVRTGWLFNRP